MSPMSAWEVEKLSQPLVFELWASWGQASASWWQRLSGGGGQAPVEIGQLCVDGQGMTLMRGPYEAAAVRWDVPFSLQLSWEPYEGQSCGELGLSVVSAGDARRLQVRVLWPGDCVDAAVPRQRSSAPFINPEVLGPLWATLARLAGIHGRSVPVGLNVAVDARRLEGLVSRGEPAVCANCEGFNVIWLAPAAYRCVSCGYEGGEGLGQHLEARRKAMLLAETPEERAQKVREHLSEAHGLLHNAARRRDEPSRRRRNLLRVVANIEEAWARLPSLRDVLESHVALLMHKGPPKESVAQLRSLRGLLAELIDGVPETLPAPNTVR